MQPVRIGKVSLIRCLGYEVRALYVPFQDAKFIAELSYICYISIYNMALNVDEIEIIPAQLQGF